MRVKIISEFWVIFFYFDFEGLTIRTNLSLVTFLELFCFEQHVISHRIGVDIINKILSIDPFRKEEYALCQDILKG